MRRRASVELDSESQAIDSHAWRASRAEYPWRDSDTEQMSRGAVALD